MSIAAVTMTPTSMASIACPRMYPENTLSASAMNRRSFSLVLLFVNASSAFPQYTRISSSRRKYMAKITANRSVVAPVLTPLKIFPMNSPTLPRFMFRLASCSSMVVQNFEN